MYLLEMGTPFNEQRGYLVYRKRIGIPKEVTQDKGEHRAIDLEPKRRDHDDGQSIAVLFSSFSSYLSYLTAIPENPIYHPNSSIYVLVHSVGKATLPRSHAAAGDRLIITQDKICGSLCSRYDRCRWMSSNLCGED